MEKYQSYKIISEPWIGDIPSHWIKSRVGRHFKIERGRVISKEEIQDNIGDYPVYSSQTSNNGELGRISTYDFDGEYVTWTTDGEKTGTCFHRTGKFNTTNVCGMLSLRESNSFSLKYLNYYLNQVTRPYVRLDINPKLMNNMMSEIPLIIPSIHEQHQIVQFLNSKTELIDKLISTKERKITLLNEQRTSLINQVVTKGLNPKVKMRDSGVEWIGEIPEGWEKGRLKHFLFTKPDNGLFKKKDDFGSGVRFVNVSDLFNQNNKIDINKLEKVNVSSDELNKSRLTNGDIFFVRSSLKLEGIGVSSIIENIEEDIVFDCHIIRIKPDKVKIFPKYLITLLNSFSYRNYLISVSESVTMTTISQDKIKDIVFHLPPLSEQYQIVEYLDFKIKEIDDIVQLEQKKIDLLKEYRQSLISEVVTGKIKVTTDE